MHEIRVETVAYLLTLLECRYNVSEILCYEAHDGREVRLDRLRQVES